MTITDIAKLANVSKATVSRVLNNKPDGVSEATRERVKRIISEVGYIPNYAARSISLPETRTVGIIIPDVTNPFFAQIAKGIEDVAVKEGYAVFLCNSDGSRTKEEKYIASLINKRVDGVILTSSVSHMTEDFMHSQVEKYDIPVILLDRIIRGIEYAGSIVVDNETGSYESTRFFIKRGHTKIVFLSGPGNVNTAAERIQGYQKAMREAGFTVNIIRGQFTAESGYKMGLTMLQKYPCTTAVVASNDVIALGCMRALIQHNISVPGDIEVMGFDDIDMCQMVTPTLSTMSQSAYSMGSQAMDLLVDRLTTPTSRGCDIVVKAKMILRESTKKEPINTKKGESNESRPHSERRTH